MSSKQRKRQRAESGQLIGMASAARLLLLIFSCYSLPAVLAVYAPAYEHDDGSHTGAFTMEERRRAAARRYRDGLDELSKSAGAEGGGERETQLGKALPHLRAACRLCPSNSTYWNDLGVVEMRLGLHEKAMLRFQTALQTDGADMDARSNQALLRQAYRRDDFFEDLQELRATNHLGLRIKHRVQNLTRLAIGDLYKAENIDFATGKLPFVLTGAMIPERGYDQASVGATSLSRVNSFSPPKQSFLDIKNLASEQQFNASFVDFYPVGMFGAGTRTLPYFLTVPRALREIWAPSAVYPDFDGADASAYIQWNVDYKDWKHLESRMGFLPPLLTSDFEWIDECWPTESERTKFTKDHHWRILLVGVQGAGMFNHKDTLRTASWQAITAGGKRFHICDSTMDPYIYKAGEVDTFAPDYSKFPLASKLDCYLEEVRSGEILYYPRDYWHQSKNLVDGTVALTGTLVNAWNFDSVSEQLLSTYISKGEMSNLRQCDPQNDHHGGRFCEGMKKCFDHWIRTFGMQWLSLLQ